MDKKIPEAVLDRACGAYVQIADDCMGLVRRKAMRAALTVALGDAQRLVAKLAAHVRPTCSELWDEAQAFLAAEGAQAEECCVPDASESSFILPGCDPLVEKLLSIVIEDKEQERTTARAEQPAAICTCPHQDAREPYHDVACPARPAQQPAADHSQCGRGDPENGPNDPDCAHRGGPSERECAQAGCGFCIAAQQQGGT